MQKAYQIVATVHDAYRGLCVKLSRMTGKSDVWHRPHGYEPRTDNPLANGNRSEVDDYMAFCERYEAAQPGSGSLLSSRVHAELSHRFAENDLIGGVTQQELHVDILDEVCDVKKWLVAQDIEHASKNDLEIFEAECDEAIEAIQAAKARARVIRLQSNIKPMGSAA